MAHCGECNMDFCKLSNLRAHVKRKHPDKLDTLAPITRKPSGSGNYSCSECDKCFASFGKLRFHVKQKHSDKLEELAPVQKKLYKCNHCDYQFDLIKHLIKHRSSHNIKKPIKCSLCQYTGASTDILVQHYKQDHNLEIINETLEFDSVEDFQVWKSRTEAETFASFVQKSGAKKSFKHTKTMYFCHRSGNIRTRGNNIRKPKIHGSNKIGGYCPAKMTVLINDEKCIVQFCKSHVGHDQKKDIAHLFIPKSQRENIAAKIAAKIPLQAILDEVRDSVENSSLERIHLLTKKDLYNIKDALNLKGSSVRHANVNDAVSMEDWAWVNELKTSDPVPFYKPQDSLCEKHPEMKSDDSGLVQALSTTRPVSNLQKQVDARRKKLLQLVQEELLNVTSLDEIEAAERILAPLKSTLASVRTTSSKTPHNKNILPQRRLFATKQYRKKKATLKEPSAEEADVLLHRE